MIFRVKVFGAKREKVQRLYFAEIETKDSKEVLAEVFKGRQAVGNGSHTEIRCGDDDKFYGVEQKADIINWIDKRLKEDKKNA